MQQYFSALRKCPLFTGVEDGDLFSMLGCLNARVVRAERGQAFFREGDPAEAVGVVLSGAVQVVRDDYYGNRSILAMVEPGELFGETFACAGLETLPVSAVAAAESRAMFLNCKRILTVCGNSCAFHGQLVANLLKVVAGKNVLLNQKNELLAKRTIRERLMAYLLGQAKKNGESSFLIPYDRQALADYLGVERSALSAEIGRLRREGVLRSRKNRFELL